MIGTIILLGPPALTSIVLAITMIYNGFEELRKTQKSTYRTERDVRRYIEEVKEMMKSLSIN